MSDTIERCRTCLHRIKMESGKGFAMYCDLFRSNRTRNGHLRVKCNQPNCSRYEYSATGMTQNVPDNQLSLFE